MINQSYLFRDKLKSPGYLSQFDVARIRKITQEASEQDFQEYMSCSIECAKRILSFWEIAQVELWDAEILKRFFHVCIYEDREIVSARIQASIRVGRLSEHFSPDVGLQWLESENVLIGMMGHWVRANARRRKDKPQTIAFAASEGNDADQMTRLGDGRLSWLREAGGNVSQKDGVFRVVGMAGLVRHEKASGALFRSEKTIREQLKSAYGREVESKRGGHFDRLGSR